MPRAGGSTSWRLHERDVCLLSVISPPAVFGAASLPTFSGSSSLGEVSDFALAPLLFGKALAAGWPWVLFTRLFSGLLLGRFCNGGLGFVPERGKHPASPPGVGWQCGVSSFAAEPEVVFSVYFDDVCVGYVGYSRTVFGSVADGRGPMPAWLVR